jgi:hypothetical protein
LEFIKSGKTWAWFQSRPGRTTLKPASTEAWAWLTRDSNPVANGMIYADISCLLKVLRPEPLSGQVWSAIEAESAVVISALAELETLVQLKAAWTGSMTRNQWRQAEVGEDQVRSLGLTNSISPAPIKSHIE